MTPDPTLSLTLTAKVFRLDLQRSGICMLVSFPKSGSTTNLRTSLLSRGFVKAESSRTILRTRRRAPESGEGLQANSG